MPPTPGERTLAIVVERNPGEGIRKRWWWTATAGRMLGPKITAKIGYAPTRRSAYKRALDAAGRLPDA
jgi:hypothetical protein